MSAEPPEARSAADARLDEHLDLLRTDAPAGNDSLAHRVVRTARWQGAVRTPLRAAISLLGAAAHGLGVLLGVRKGSR
jgi:hypothetical protein